MHLETKLMQKGRRTSGEEMLQRPQKNKMSEERRELELDAVIGERANSQLPTTNDVRAEIKDMCRRPTMLD